MKPNRLQAVLAGVNWWLVLVTAATCLCGLVFIASATQDDVQFEHQQGKQLLFVVCSLGIGFFCLLPHYVHVLRLAWPLYGLMLVLLAGLFVFGSTRNGSTRWYAFPGFTIQPSEFAKLAVVIALAALLRFKSRARAFDGLVVPMLVTAAPALLILRQPDLGSTLVLGPVLLAMCHAAGAPLRSIVLVLLLAAAGAFLAYFTVMQDYQVERVQVWLQHWTWTPERLQEPEVVNHLRGPGYQPWQALIALGGGGALGFGIARGPQNRYDFLPYRSEDYVFAVVGEEAGFLGCTALLLLFVALVLGLLHIANRTRERFGRLLCVGVATWIGGQALLHAAVCGWLLPATGLPMPLVSYGGSSTLAAVLGIALCLNVGARPEPVLAADGFR